MIPFVIRERWYMIAERWLYVKWSVRPPKSPYRTGLRKRAKYLRWALTPLRSHDLFCTCFMCYG